MEWILCAIGLCMVIEGAPWFLSPEKMRQWVRELSQQPDKTLRSLGLGLMMAGLLLVYLGRSG